jgi:hypothetical protein
MEWRGRLNIMLYRVDLRCRVDDDELALIVDSILRRQRFGDDPEEFYGALVSALRSGLPLAEDGRQDEDVFRAALVGLVERFDALRPWPPEPFVEQDVRRWDELRAAPVVGVIRRRTLDVELAFGLDVRPVTVGADHFEVLVVRMSGGQLVGLRASGIPDAPAVEVRSPAEPAAVRAEIAAAAGLTVEAL